MSGVIELPPDVQLPADIRLSARLLRIRTRYEDGVPEELTLIPADCPVELVKGDVFVVAYFPHKLVNR